MSMQALLNNGDEVLIPAPTTAVDRRGQPRRRQAGALPVRRAGQLVAGPRRHQGEDHAEYQGDGDHQPEQPHRRGVFQGSAGRHGRTGPPAQPGAVLRRDLRQDPLRRRRPRLHRLAGAGRALPDLQRPVQILPGAGFRSAGWRSPGPSGHRAISKVSTSSPTCACASTSRRSTRSRPPWAATRASTIWSCRRAPAERNRAWELLNDIPGVSCVKPMGALYAFPRIDPKVARSTTTKSSSSTRCSRKNC